MPRFFVPAAAIDPAARTVTIVGADAHHIARSLRLAVGDAITVCDGAGAAWDCRLTHIRDDAATAELLSPRPASAESPLSIRLFVAYPKGDKLETVVQKAVELGAARITPFESERCVKRPPADRIARVTERQRRIAEEAAKQCGRCVVPTVDPPLPFSAAVREAAEAELALFCYEGRGTRSLRAVLAQHPSVESVSVVVGAEGGFSEREVEEAAALGCIPVGLGARILRCETAPAYVLAALSLTYELPL